MDWLDKIAEKSLKRIIYCASFIFFAVFIVFPPGNVLFAKAFAPAFALLGKICMAISAFLWDYANNSGWG